MSSLGIPSLPLEPIVPAFVHILGAHQCLAGVGVGSTAWGLGMTDVIWAQRKLGAKDL